jgi:hypothetical protein
MDGFKSYLINEERGHLGKRVNDVLTGMQDLQGDMENLGARHLNRLAEQIVNEIRKILHSQWAPRNHKHLKELQKIAVAIQKTIEDKGDLKEMLPAALQATQDLAGKLGVKVNDLQAPELMPGEEASQDDFELTGQGPQEQPPEGQEQPQMPPDPGMDPNQGMPPQGPQQPPGGPPGQPPMPM